MRHILITGKPRTGKTTLLKVLLKSLKNAGGFYTQEIRQKGKRTGFKIITLDGREGVLAKKGLRSRYHLGEYGINIKDLERVAVGSVQETLRDESKQIVVVDEIGKMELSSDKFKETVVKVLESKKSLLGVMHRADLPFLNEIRGRKDVKIFELRKENWNGLFKELENRIRKIRPTYA